MAKQLFSHDPMTGISIWFDYNELTDETILEYTADVEPYLEFNKAAANDPEVTKHGIKNDLWLYASIPNIIATKWLIEEGLDIYDDNAWPQISKKLNDPEYAYLKTTHKRHVFKG